MLAWAALGLMFLALMMGEYGPAVLFLLIVPATVAASWYIGRQWNVFRYL